MSSSRESSPASESGAASPTQLTPNSKVKAMLAAFDNDSDDESVSGSARARMVSSLRKRTPAKPSNSNESTKPSEEPKPDKPGRALDADSEDDDEDIVRPK